jgi:hypothetical protein
MRYKVGVPIKRVVTWKPWRDPSAGVIYLMSVATPDQLCPFGPVEQCKKRARQAGKSDGELSALNFYKKRRKYD